jgi:ADP-heptose:LPS heptosyltransferase
VHPGSLGDVLLALPAIADLGRLLPGMTRVLAVMPRMCELLGTLPGVACVPFDSLGLHRLFVPGGDRDVSAWLRGFGAIVSWFGADDEVYRAHLLGLGRPLVVARSRPGGACVHVSRHLALTLASLGPPVDALPAVRLDVPAPELAWAERWLRAHGLCPGDLVAVHAGAGSPEKIWPGFGRLVAALRVRGVPVVSVTGPADRGRPPLGGGEILVAEGWSLPRLAALQSLARAFVANDSGPAHLAALVGCPTLALFGPTDPALWVPGGGTASHVTALSGRGVPGDPWAGLTVARVLVALDEMPVRS